MRRALNFRPPRPRTLAEQALVEVLQDQNALWMYAREVFFTDIGDASISADAHWMAMTDEQRAPYGQRVIALFQKEAESGNDTLAPLGARVSCDSPLIFLSG